MINLNHHIHENNQKHISMKKLFTLKNLKQKKRRFNLLFFLLIAILDDSIEKAETKLVPIFNLEVPTSLPNVNPDILDPRDTYEDAKVWEEKARDLAGMFIKNFEKYTDNKVGKALMAAGPQL